MNEAQVSTKPQIPEAQPVLKDLSGIQLPADAAFWRCMERLIAGAAGEYKIYVCSTGAAAGIGGVLTSVPGSSKIFLGSQVPYEQAILAQFVHRKELGKAVSEDIAIAMANQSFLLGQEALVRSNQIEGGKPRVIGLGLTAAIASGPRRGEDRMHVAVRMGREIATGYFQFTKGLGQDDRLWQDRLAQTIALDAICSVAEVEPIPVDTSRITCRRGQAGEAGVSLAPLAYPDIPRDRPVLIMPEGIAGDIQSLDPEECIVYPGSFRHFHCGHDLAARSGMESTGKKVVFEITGVNIDKTPIDWDELLKRSLQFRSRYGVILRQDAASFVEKADKYPPGTHYIVGFDTATRILDPKYYPDDWEGVRKALAFFDKRGTRFHVLGRKQNVGGKEVFLTNEDIWCPVGYAHLFLKLRGQLNISATALEATAGPG